MLDFYGVLFIWKDESVIRWSKWSEKLIPKQMNLGDPTDPATEQLIRAAIYTNRLYVWLRNYKSHTCLYAEIPSTLDFWNYRQNWSKEEENGIRVTKMILVIERILLLPWIQRVMIYLTERYETNGDFLVFRSVGYFVSLIQVSKQIET